MEINKMNQNIKQQIIEQLVIEFTKSEYLKDIDLSYYSNKFDDVDNVDNLRDIITEIIGENSEIIYYASAIEFLKENDCSLTESLSIADEYGFELKNLNSEKLASILNDRLMNEEFYQIIDHVVSQLPDEDIEE